MKITQFISFALFLFIINGKVAFSQIATIQTKEKIGTKKAAFYPVLNKGGDKILFTSENYNGLEMFDLNTKNALTISDKKGSGFEPVFENKTDRVIHRETTFVDGRKLQSVNIFDTQKSEQHEIVPYMRNLQTTVPLPSKSMLLRNAINSEIRVYSNMQAIIVHKNGKKKVLKPFSENDVNGYIWATLSPDKKRILFYAVGKGTYIADLNGKVDTYLGDVQAPQWFGKNYVIGMQTKSNEFTYTASRILIVQIDGKKKQYLTDENEIAMYPTAACDVNKIAYNTPKGELYLLTLKLHKK